MRVVDTVIEASWILPIAPNNTVLTDHAIVVDAGDIIDLLPAKLVKERYQTRNHQILNDHILMPGLVNAHAHTPMNLFRGFADDLDLMTWLNDHIWPAEKAIINEASTYIGTQLAAAEMIRGGVTSFNDHYFFPQASAEAAVNTGIRACIGLWMGNVETLFGSSEAEYLSKAEAQLNADFSNDLITWSMAVHGTYTISDNGLTSAKAFADHHQLPVHMHVHETAAELNIEHSASGRRPIKRIQDAGLLNKRFTAVHMVHLNEDDLARTKDSGCHVVTCPTSNLKLASGLPQLKTLSDITHLGIGTDGAASNNTLDLFHEMRLTALVAKGESGDPSCLPVHRILNMATLGGAKAMQLDHRIGSLEKGKAADMIAIRMDHPFTYPMYDPMSHVVFAANRSQVNHVWVNGKQLLADGEFTTLNPKAIMEAAEPYIEKARSMAYHAHK